MKKLGELLWKRFFLAGLLALLHSALVALVVIVVIVVIVVVTSSDPEAAMGFAIFDIVDHPVLRLPGPPGPFNLSVFRRTRRLRSVRLSESNGQEMEDGVKFPLNALLECGMHFKADFADQTVAPLQGWVFFGADPGRCPGLSNLAPLALLRGG
jgi:hypothetical protein